MKHRSIKTCLFILFLFFITPAYSASIIPSQTPWLEKVRISSILNLKDRDIMRMQGRKLNATSRLGLFLLRKRIRRTMLKKGDISLGEFIKPYKKIKLWQWVLLMLLGLAVMIGFVVLALAMA